MKKQKSAIILILVFFVGLSVMLYRQFTGQALPVTALPLGAPQTARGTPHPKRSKRKGRCI